MNISEHLKKPFWVRKVTGGSKTVRKPKNENTNYYYYPSGSAKPDEIYLTYEDFIAEIEQSAHEQMGDFQSSCPVHELKTDPKDPTKKRWMIDHYDDVEVTTTGVQKRGANNFTSHMAGKGFGVASEQKDNRDIFDALCSWKDIVGINTTAFMEICQSIAYTCDALIYQYTTNNKKDIEYTVFSFLKGDMIFTDIDEDRNPVYYRKYSIKNKVAVDVFSTKRVQTWIAYNDSDENWKQKISKWFNRASGSQKGSISEDGFICISDEETQTPDGVNPCTYFRVPDLRSGSSQLNIESYERATSMVAEEYKENAFSDFFVKAEKIVSLPPRGKFGRRTYGVKGTSDSIKNADAHFIAPPDASNIAQLNLNIKWEDIKNSMQLVFIDPEILKSGADSSTTIKILFTPELQYCQLMWIYLFKPLKHMMNVFKNLVGIVERNPKAYNDLRISIYPDFWIPNNTAEEIDNACKLVYAGILSQENGRNYLDLQYLNDAKIVAREKRDQLYQETYVPLQAKYEAESKFGVADVADDVIVTDTDKQDNPYKPGIDNNMARKDIAD
jgi:hypothetical protein